MVMRGYDKIVKVERRYPQGQVVKVVGGTMEVSEQTAVSIFSNRWWLLRS